MNLFFTSKKATPLLNKSLLDSFLAEKSLYPSPEKSARLEQLILILISQHESGVIDLLEVRNAAKLLETFEKNWNTPDRTPALATEHTFELLYLLSNSPKLQKMITDTCLSDFFSSVVSLEQCLDFEKTNKEHNNLMVMSSNLYYVQLGLCFFEAQINPYWSLPVDVFFRNIYYIPPECSPLFHVNKLRCLLLLSELVFNTVEFNKASPEPSKDVFFKLQGYLMRIRMIFLRIIERETSSANIVKYLKQEYEFFLEHDHRPACAAYIIFTTTAISSIKELIYPHFAPYHETFCLLKQAFNDPSDPGERFDESLDACDLAEFALPTTEFEKISLDAIYLSIRSLVDKGDIKSIYALQKEFDHISPVVNDVLLREDAFFGPSLITDILSIFDKKKCAKGRSFLSTERLDNAGYVHSILFFLFPKIKDRVHYFTKTPLTTDFKNSVLANLINCHLMLLLVFNETHYFTDRNMSPQLFKKKIEQNLIFVLEDPLVFISSFHLLYFLAYTQVKSHSELQGLLDDLRVILDVLREGGEKFKLICNMLLDTKDGNIPLESIESIKPLIDKQLWVVEQEAEKERIRLLEESLLAEPEKSPHVAGAKKKKKKKAVELPVAKQDREVDNVSPALDLKESDKTITLSEVAVGLAEISTPIAVEVPLPSASASSVSALSPPISEASNAVKSLLPFSKMTMANIERLSELNQLLSRDLEAFRTEIRLYLGRTPVPALAEQNTLRDLDKCLDDRQKIIPILRGYLKKARKQAVIPFAMEPFTTQRLLLPDWLEPWIRKQQDILHSCIELLQPIEEDKSCTLSLHIPALIEVLRSVSIPMCSLRELRSFHYLSRFSAFFSAFMHEFTPVLVRIISNESHHFLGEVAIDAKNFGQLILQVQHWSYRIATAPFDIYGWETPGFQFPSQRSPLEVVNPAVDLRNRLFNLIGRWNFEVNSFAMLLSKVITFEPESTFINNMKQLLDRLSSCYFKNSNYPCEQLINRLFHPLAEVELYGTQLFMRDSVCDVDLRLKWREPYDSYEQVVEKINMALIKQGASKAAAELRVKKHKLFNSDGSFVTVLKIKIPMEGIFPLPLDVSIFVGTYFPLVSYASHAAGILDTRTGRISCPHDFFESVLKNQLLIKEPSCPDFSDKSRCSRLTHVLKLIVRAAYCELPEERIYLGESAAKILGLLKATKISELKKVQPHWVEALDFLLKQHFDHYEFTAAFFKRMAVLLAFYKDIGCTLVADSGAKTVELIAVNKELPQLVCKVVSNSEQLPVAKEGSPNSLFVTLPQALQNHVSLMVQVPYPSLGFFGNTVARPVGVTPEQYINTKGMVGIP